MSLQGYLMKVVDETASDLYLISGGRPSIRKNGIVHVIDTHILQSSEIIALTKEFIGDVHLNELSEMHELNLAITCNQERFRVNMFHQNSGTGLVARHVRSHIPSFEALGIPEIASQLSMTNSGLVLVVGATGMGKSTTVAAMVNHRNEHSQGHIVTIEDPIEFLHTHKNSLVTQREIGIDTDTYAKALKNALRQAPDVIVIGEIRDCNTIEHAIAFAQTGHLCIATMHAKNANQALDRILHFFPEPQHDQIRLELSFHLRAVISQSLLPSKEGSSRTPIFEILLNSPLVADIIRRNELNRMKEVMTLSSNLGMKTLDAALLEAIKANLISESQAYAHADSANNLRIALHQGSDSEPQKEKYELVEPKEKPRSRRI